MYRGPDPSPAQRVVWREEDDALLRFLRARRLALARVEAWFEPHGHVHEAPGDAAVFRRCIDGLAGLVETADEEVLLRAERGEPALLEQHLDGEAHAHRFALVLDGLADLALGEPAARKLALRLRVRALKAWRACAKRLRDEAASLAPELSSEQRQEASDDAALAALDACILSAPLHVVGVDRCVGGEDWVSGRVRSAMRSAVRAHLQGARLRIDALAAEAAGKAQVEAFCALALDIQSLHDARAVEVESAKHPSGDGQVHALDTRFILDVDGPLLSSAVEFAWKLYHAKANGSLRRLITGLRPAMLRVAQTVRSGELAYASRVAQLYVFDAETEEVLDAQFLAVETALLLCPTHRNARVVAADLHAHRGHLWLRGGNAKKAREEAEMARALWPDNRRLATLDAALAGR